MQGHLFTLDLKLFCAPRARIKIFDIFKISHGKKFRSSNFRILELYAKYAKFCTIQKFPAIRYQSHCYHFLNVCTKRETTLQLATRAAAILRAAHNPQQRYVPACLEFNLFTRTTCCQVLMYLCSHCCTQMLWRLVTVPGAVAGPQREPGSDWLR